MATLTKTTTQIVCPSYWMAEAYSQDQGRAAYKYQYSVPAALHGSDVSLWFGPASANQGANLARAAMTLVGNFVMRDDPSIPVAVADGASAAGYSNGTGSDAASDPASAWPAFEVYSPYQLNINQTGGVPTVEPVLGVPNATEYVGPGLTNALTLVNAYTWEGGRGYRCDFWRSVGALVPE